MLTMILLFALQTSATPDPATCPMHAQHMAAAADHSAEHGHDVDQRHDTLGMSHDASTHSFRLFDDGGAIELRANEGSDAATVAAIRSHLQRIAKQFAAGDFATPMFVHGRTPAGVEGMKLAGAKVMYHYEEVPAGGRVRIHTTDPAAVAAVHDFLRFQVTEHRTADSGEVEHQH